MVDREGLDKNNERSFEKDGQEEEESLNKDKELESTDEESHDSMEEYGDSELNNDNEAGDTKGSVTEDLTSGGGDNLGKLSDGGHEEYITSEDVGDGNDLSSLASALGEKMKNADSPKGGDSDKNDTPEDDEDSGDLSAVPAKEGAGKKALKAGAQAAVAAAPVVAKVGAFALLVMALKKLLMQIIAAIQYIWSTIMNFLIGAFQMLAATFGAVVAGLLMAAFPVAAVAVGIGLVVAFLGPIFNNNVAAREGHIESCETNVNKVVSDFSEMPVDQADVVTLGNAKKIHSVFSELGASDEAISGILGNFTAESGIDATSIEGIFGEQHTLGPRKQEAMSDLDAYALNTLFPNYAAQGQKGINKSFYSATSDGKHIPGLGLGQFTGPRGEALLNYADANSLPWHIIDLQLAFMLGGDGGYSNTLKDYASGSYDTPEGAAIEFMTRWEGLSSSNSSAGARKSSAVDYFLQIDEWSSDTNYAMSIINMAGTAVNEADLNRVKTAQDKCMSTMYADNSSIAHAAVSYAHPRYEDSFRNDGTPLYQSVKQCVLPEDEPYRNMHFFFQSCDRSSMSAVRWSGADEDIAFMSVQSILNYVTTSDRWTEIPWQHKEENLLPGDIMIIKDAKNSHVQIYVGPEIPKLMYPEENYTDLHVIVDGSIDGAIDGRDPSIPGRSPTVKSEDVSKLPSNYRVFRNVSQSGISKYGECAALGNGGMMQSLNEGSGGTGSAQ